MSGQEQQGQEDDGSRLVVRRTGPGQVFGLSAPGVEQRWCVKQWASKPRPSRQEYHPWWYREGQTWHLYAGDTPKVTEDGELMPPMASFGTLGQVRVYVESLLPPQGSSG